MSSGLVLAGRRLILRALDSLPLTTCSWDILFFYFHLTTRSRTVGTVCLWVLFSSITSRLVFASLGSCIFYFSSCGKGGSSAASRQGLEFNALGVGSSFIYLFILLCWSGKHKKHWERRRSGKHEAHTHTHTRDLDLKDPAQQAYRQEDDERKGNDDAQLAFCVLDISPPSVKTQYQKLPTQKALCELDFRRLSFSNNDSVPDIHCPYEHY